MLLDGFGKKLVLKLLIQGANRVVAKLRLRAFLSTPQAMGAISSLLLPGVFVISIIFYVFTSDETAKLRIRGFICGHITTLFAVIIAGFTYWKYIDP